MKTHIDHAATPQLAAAALFLTMTGLASASPIPASPPKDVPATGPAPRIVNGSPAPRGAYPWMVSLTHPQSSPAGHFCGGALVGSNWVLTASHCVHGDGPSDVSVWVGMHDRSNPAGARRVAVSQVITHPEYTDSNAWQRGNDVALLRLATPVTDLAPIPIVSAESEVPVGSVARAIGWGRTGNGQPLPNVLQQVDVRIANRQVINDVFGLTPHATMLPTLGINGNQRTGPGDSGGPLMRLINNQWKLAGVTSFGPTDLSFTTAPSVFANLHALKPWIDQQMSGSGGGGGGGGGTTDDHGNDMARATSVAAAGSTGGVIEAAGDLDFFRFSIPSTSRVTLRSTGGSDPVGVLMNSGGSVLAENDDTDGTNFRISRSLAAGTYFVKVRGYGSSTGSYTLVRTVEPEVQPEVAVRHHAADLPSGGTVQFNNNTVGGSAERTLTILNSGNGSLSVSGLSVSGSSAFRIVGSPASSIAPGRESSFNIRFAPASAGNHSAVLTFSNNDADENPFRINLAGYAEQNVTDDLPNAIAGNTPILPLNSARNGTLERNGDIDCVRFYLPRTLTVTVQTTGSTDTYGHLYNSAGTQLTEDDDSGSGFNFHISRRLSAGWYHLRVRGYGNMTTGAYQLRLAAQ